MSSKAQKLRNKRAARATSKPDAAPGEKALVLRHVGKRQSMKPTQERRSRGVWVDGKVAQPDVDLASDMAGALYQDGKITQQQLETARAFSEVRAAYVAEFAVPGYKSCLAGGFGGHDDGDGNPAVLAEYARMTRGLTKPQVMVLEIGLEMTPDSQRVNVPVLRGALDAMGG